MRVLFFTFAAILSIAAVALRFFPTPNWLAVISIIAAGIFLVLAFRLQWAAQEDEPIVLDEKRKDTLRELREQGDHGGAIRQVQLWYRNTSAEDARKIVQELE